MLDHQYSDEMIELVNWGIEGLTFQRSPEGNVYIPEITTQSDYITILAEFGVSSTMSSRTGIQWVTQDMASQFRLRQPIPYMVNGAVSREYNFWMATHANGVTMSPNEDRPFFILTPDEKEFVAKILPPVNIFIEESVVDFIIGRRSMDEWDDFISEISNFGDVDRLLRIFNDHLTKAE